MTDETCGGCTRRGGSGVRQEGRRPELAELLASGRTTCSIEAASRILGIGRSTAYAAARDGSLPTLRISHRLLVPTAKLMAMLGCEEQPMPAANVRPAAEAQD